MRIYYDKKHYYKLPKGQLIVRSTPSPSLKEYEITWYSYYKLSKKLRNQEAQQMILFS